MLTEIRFQDGFLLHGTTEDEMVAGAEAHVREAHPDLAELITRDQILVTVREAPFAMRANGIDTSQRVFGRCPFDRWELSLGYGLR
jgi:hypothetical protein